MKNLIILLGILILGAGKSCLAYENTTMSADLSGQRIDANNKICDSLANDLANDLMKQMLKQTIYNVGTTVLNKYMNNNAPVVATPVYTQPVTTQTYTTPVYAPTTTETYTTPVYAPTTTTQYEQTEQMIIIQ